MFLLKRRWLLSTLLVLFAAAVMVRLGVWQLDRLQQKRSYIAAALAEVNASPLLISGAETDLDASQQRYRPAVVQGVFDFDREVLVKNKLYQGQPGFHLLTPLRIAGSERAVLVDRGWIPATQASPEQTAGFHTPTAAATVQGRIEPADRRPPGAVSPGEPQREWYRVDIQDLQGQMPYELLPFYVALTPAGQSGPPYANPPEIILDEGPHLGYAIQWFLFAAVVPVVYAIQVRRIERKEAAADGA